MSAWVVDGGFGLDALRWTARPAPEPGPGQVRVRITAASLNYRDLRVIEGNYDPRLPRPRVPGSDGCGVVDAIGPGARGVAVGDRVMPIFVQGWLDGPPTRARLQTTLGHHRDGVFAAHLIADADGVVRAPDGWTDAEVACVPCAAVTAWRALVSLGGIKAGDVVLVQGTGGVSIAALQIAKLHGARVFATTGRPARAARLRALGADHVLPRDGWGKAARDLGGVDHVVDVGGAGTLDAALTAVRPGGTISSIGMLGGMESPLALNKLFMQQIRLQGVIVGSRADAEAVLRAYDAGGLRPVIDRGFPMQGLKDALGWLTAGEHFGKVVLTT